MTEEPDPELERIRRRKMHQLMAMQSKGVDRVEGVGSDPVVLTDANIEQHISSGGVLVVDCWAPWCMPCRMLSPIVDQLARDYSGRVRFGKLNVDENPLTARRFNTMSIPTLLVFKEGVNIDRIVGAQPKGILKSRIDSYL